MELVEVSAKEKDNYNNFVASHESGSFLQSFEWGQWQETLGNEVSRFIILEENEIALSAQVIKTKIPKIGKYYLYIGYGPLIKEQAVDFFITELKKKFSDAIFIRMEPKQNLQLNNFKLTKHIQPGRTLIVNLEKTEETLLAAMHPKTRYNIKVAQKHEVKIISELIITPGHGLHLKEVAELLVSTAVRQGYKSHGLSYYQKLIDFFGIQPHSETKLSVYKALYGQKLLACGVMVDFGNTRTYLFGGTSTENKNVMAPYALHWQAMQDAKTTGLTAYDFWGIETASGETPGFVRFKMGFGGAAVNYPPAQDLVLNKLWYNAYKVLRKINKKIAR